MREILEAVATGDLSPAEAEAELIGYTTADAGRFDATRVQRSGIPEAILAAGKTPEEVTALAEAAIETTGKAIVTRAAKEVEETLRQSISENFPTVSITYHDRAKLVVARTDDASVSPVNATITVVTGGTVDTGVAQEAALIAEEMGPEVNMITDVGVASLTRVVDQLDRLRESDVLVVAAGREGALPTVVAGLVDSPVIGLPVSSGYGYGGEGKAALMGMLQSCTVLSVVNIDAGFVAGAQAGLIAKAVAE